MKRRLFFILFFIVFCLYGICQDSSIDAPKEESKPLVEQWKETLLYGIADEILPVIDKIKATNEDSLYTELVKVFSESINIDIRKKILALFSDNQYTPAKEPALKILENYDEESSELIVAVINYLAEINAIESLELIESVIESNQHVMASAALGAISKMKAFSKEDYLLEKLKDDEFSEKIKPEIIRTLGDIKSQKAVEILMGFLENTDEEKTWRLYSAESLGKIGDTRALPLLKKVFEEKDALIKAYAAKALSFFNMEEVIDILIQGLKDSNWKVRQASAEALANKDAAAAIEILKYKAKNDPVNRIKLEALKALSAIGNQQCIDFLMTLFEDEKTALDLREQALSLVLEKNPAHALDGINRVLEKDWTKKNTKALALNMVAKHVSSTKHNGLAPVYKKMLSHEYFLVRIFAIRGIVFNKMGGFRSELEAMLKSEKTENVKQEIERALDKL
ncbi:MAG: HEAT repeat domain-containing protein [Spirochaetales bacterium]|nr:HEAT repeat domain-containing protein [Spirochaetales bacterium]